MRGIKVPYGTLMLQEGRDVEAGANAPHSREARRVLVFSSIAMLVTVSLCSVAVISQQEQPQQVDLAAAPAASDFFVSALQGLERRRFGARGRGPAHREVSLKKDKDGNVNLNVDIERNGQLVGREEGLKVPEGKSAHIQLTMPQRGRLQELDEDSPALDVGDDGMDESLGEEDTSDLGQARRDARDAKERVIEDARRLHDITKAIQEESDKAKNAADYRVAAQEGEEAAKRRAIEEFEREKDALREAKTRADTVVLKREAATMKAKIAATKAAAAKQATELAAENAKIEAARAAEQRAMDQYKVAKAERAGAVQRAQQLAVEEAHEDAKAKTDKKKEGAVNMNIKVNVDSPVGGDYVSWEERCATEPMLAGCSPGKLEAKKEEERRQVNMNIVVNVRSPTDTVPGAAVVPKAAMRKNSQQFDKGLPEQPLAEVHMPRPP
jgi:hypothetical protein